MTDIFERRAVISGIGQSSIGRRLGRSGLDLTLDAVLAALADAGLDRSEVDGVASGSGYAVAPGASPVSTMDLKESLRLAVNWYAAASDSSQMSALIHACMAVAAGQARHVIVFRTVTEATARLDARLECLPPHGSMGRCSGVHRSTHRRPPTGWR